MVGVDRDLESCRCREPRRRSAGLIRREDSRCRPSALSTRAGQVMPSQVVRRVWGHPQAPHAASASRAQCRPRRQSGGGSPHRRPRTGWAVTLGRSGCWDRRGSARCTHHVKNGRSEMCRANTFESGFGPVGDGVVFDLRGKRYRLMQNPVAWRPVGCSSNRSGSGSAATGSLSMTAATIQAVSIRTDELAATCSGGRQFGYLRLRVAYRPGVTFDRPLVIGRRPSMSHHLELPSNTTVSTP